MAVTVIAWWAVAQRERWSMSRVAVNERVLRWAVDRSGKAPGAIDSLLADAAGGATEAVVEQLDNHALEGLAVGGCGDP